MSRRRTLLLAAALVAWLVILWAVEHHFTSPQKPVSRKTPLCSSAAHPCIELADNYGKPLGIKFNDFRFGPAGCIYYRMTTADRFKEHCGGYTLEWIGPGLPPGREGTI